MLGHAVQRRRSTGRSHGGAGTRDVLLWIICVLFSVSPTRNLFLPHPQSANPIQPEGIFFPPGSTDDPAIKALLNIAKQMLDHNVRLIYNEAVSFEGPLILTVRLGLACVCGAGNTLGAASAAPVGATDVRRRYHNLHRPSYHHSAHVSAPAISRVAQQQATSHDGARHDWLDKQVARNGQSVSQTRNVWTGRQDTRRGLALPSARKDKRKRSSAQCQRGACNSAVICRHTALMGVVSLRGFGIWCA